jgi:hypothetical protein
VRKSAAILIYSNPESEAANALASVPIDAMLRSVGHRPTTVETTAEFEKQLSQGGWDLVLVSLADAEVARERVQGSAGLLPVVVKATTAEMKQAKQQFSVVLSAPTKSRTFLAVVDEALAHRSKNRAKTAKPAI